MPTDYTRRIPVDKITRTKNPVRTAFHGLICLAGWVVFAYYLYAVLLRPLEPDAITIFLLLALIAVAIAIGNQLWIWFNRGLNRKLGRRRQAPLLECTAVTDRIGRRLMGADWPLLRQAGRIRVEVDPDAGVKRYIPLPLGDHDPGADTWNG